MCLPDAAHVEVSNLHNLGEAIHPGRMRGVQLLLSNGTQGSHKLNNGFTVQLVTAQTNAKFRPDMTACNAYRPANYRPKFKSPGLFAARQYD